jgi:hypothetical protein
MRPSWIFLASCLASGAFAADPNEYDPLLDRPADERAVPSRIISTKRAVPGLRVSSHGGLYFGHIESFLTEDVSRLQRGVRPNFGFGLGRRLNSALEFGVDVDLGLGKTHQPFDGGTKSAIDVLIEPRLFAHYYEAVTWSAYGGVGGLFGLFDVSYQGVSQLGIGPTALLGVELRSDRFSALVFELSGSFFYDVYAYDDVPVTVGEGPAAMTVLQKDRGDWFQIFRLNVGYRLSGF